MTALAGCSVLRLVAPWFRAIAEAMPKRPLIWALTGSRAGDNAQVLALAHAVAVARDAVVVEKPLSYTPLRLLPNILLPPGTAVLDAASRRRVEEEPLPDLVIGVGRRSVPVARQIRKASRGRARLVWLGRPRAPLDWFDLIITTAQYGLPERSNVIMVDLPPAAPVAPPEDLEIWRERFSDLPHPQVAVLVGGERWPIRFDAREAHRLGAAVNVLLRRLGGSWIVSTSPRTGIRQSRALHEVLKKPGYFYYWREGHRENPHRALPALADAFVVTSDSASMIAEAVRSGKPVLIYRLPRSPLAPRWTARRGFMRKLLELGILSPPRDMDAFCNRLKARGLVCFLADETDGRLPSAVSTLREKDLEEAIARISRMTGS